MITNKNDMDLDTASFLSRIKEDKLLNIILDKNIELLYDSFIYPYDEIENKRNRKLNLIEEKDMLKRFIILMIQQGKLNNVI
jgi:hypothetical protein